MTPAIPLQRQKPYSPDSTAIGKEFRQLLPKTMPSEKKYWFRAKRHGWGWGASASWEGWLVRIVYAAFVGAGIHFFLREGSLAYFSIYLAAISVAAFGVCWWKGEPLRWRWGKD